MNAGGEHRRFPEWAPQLIVVPLLFFVGAKLSLLFTIMPEALVTIWLPNSLLLASLLHYGWRRFPLFALAVILAEIAADISTYSLVEAISFGFINLGEVSLAYCLLRRWRFDPGFRTPFEIAKFIAAAPVLSACLSACAGAAVYHYFGGIEADLLQFLRVWWFSDGMGLMILAPLVISVWPPGGGFRFERPDFRWYDGVALVIGMLVVLPFLLSQERVFHGVTLRSFFLLLPLLYVAARFSVRMTAANVVVVAMLLLYMVKNGQKPFGDVSVLESVTAAQELIFTMSTLSLGIAGLLAQHRADARELEARVVERTAALSRANEELQKMAVTDPLTGVFNRRAMVDMLQREMARERRYERPLALIMVDIDHFKQVNDRYGHDVGDRVLRHVAQLCLSHLRASDVIARFGGEEFVVLAPETGQAEAVQLAERLCAALRASPIAAAGGDVGVTASFGVALLEPGDADADALFRRADQAMYEAKHTGRDRVVLARAEASA